MQLSVEACAWTRQNHEDLARLARCSVLLAQLNMAALLSMLSQGMGATLRAGAPATAVIQE